MTEEETKIFIRAEIARQLAERLRPKQDLHPVIHRPISSNAPQPNEPLTQRP